MIVKLLAIKKILLTTVFVLVCQIGFCQAPPVEPKFMDGGTQRFFQFLSDEIDFLKIEGEETMRLTFYLNASGMMNDITVLQFKKQEAADEVERVLKKAPNWDMSNQDKKYSPVYRIKLIFEKNKVKGETQVSWNVNSSQSQTKVVQEGFLTDNEHHPKEDSSSLLSVAAIEQKPEFPGGLKAFYDFIAKNFILPSNKEFKSGKVFASFVIEKDGSVTDIKILRDCGFGTAEETKRVLALSPKWIPAIQNNKPVRCQYSIPIVLNK